eukprot:SAG31_NODE_1094_length_9945_cov_3.834349_3_plen_69_part_00
MHSTTTTCATQPMPSYPNGRGPGWKVSSCGSIAKGDLLRLTRKADSVVMEKCKAAPPVRSLPYCAMCP